MTALGTRVLVVSGIWPPDVGGPASHGPDLGRFLVEHGMAVRAVVTGDVPAESRGLAVRTLPRLVPVWRRMGEAAVALLAETRQADVVYATGLYTRSILGTRPWRVPIVLKLVADPAYERSRGLGLFDGSLDDFASARADPRVAALMRVRDETVARASEVIVPSEYLAERIATWRIRGTPVRVVPNAAPAVTVDPDREALRRRLGVDGPTIVFAGRLVLQKNIPLAVEAMRHVAGPATLVIIGDGPKEAEIRAAIESAGMGPERVRMLPGVAREEAIRWMQAADVTVLPSDWENHPHAVVESLAVGTPVVATTVGGVPEIVRKEEDGLLVPPGDAEAMGQALAAMLNGGARREGDVPAGYLGPPREVVFARIAEVIEGHASRRREGS